MLLNLSKDELLCILGLLPQEVRCRTIPLLCKDLARVLRSSGELYEQLEVDLTSMELCVANPADEACARLQLEDLLYWLQPRGPFAKDLRVWVVGDWESRSGETLSRALRMCSNLERLHMTSQSRVNRWLPAMFELGSLRELVLHADSTWARLPPALGKLTALERLEVRMRIDGGRAVCRGFLPLEMLGCARLAEVAFLDCRCLTISPVLGELPALTRLRVRDANLNHMDAWHSCAFNRGAWSTASLTVLDLEDCNLDVIPFQICHLEDLRALSLAGNHLRDLPRLLATYLRKLASLNLACNALQRIPPVLALMPSLRHLDMSGNVGLEVAESAGRQETGYVGSTSYRGNMSLIRLISSLPALHTLDLCKSPEPQATPWLGRLGSQSGSGEDMWTSRCREVLADVDRGIAKARPWCNQLEHFAY